MQVRRLVLLEPNSFTTRYPLQALRITPCPNRQDQLRAHGKTAGCCAWCRKVYVSLLLSSFPVMFGGQPRADVQSSRGPRGAHGFSGYVESESVDSPASPIASTLRQPNQERKEARACERTGSPKRGRAYWLRYIVHISYPGGCQPIYGFLKGDAF